MSGYNDQSQQGLALTYRCCVCPVVFDVPTSSYQLPVTRPERHVTCEPADDVNMATDWSPILVAIFEPGCDAVFFFFLSNMCDFFQPS